MSLPGLPTGPKQWLRIIKSNNMNLVIVSITSGEDKGIYSSVDLENWTKLSGGTYRMSTSFDQHEALAIDEQKAGNALILGVNGQRKIELPNSVLRAAGAFDGSAPLILYSPSLGIGPATELKKGWQAPGNIASIAASPDFRTDHIAIAGGFRSGIFRSVNGGISWKFVLSDPSTLVKGSNEIYDVVFLSSQNVIAIQGGQLTWK